MSPCIYCAKCHQKTPLGEDKVKLYQDKRGGCHMEQPCPECRTNRNRIVSKKNIPQEHLNNPKLKQGGFLLSPIIDIFKQIMG